MKKSDIITTSFVAVIGLVVSFFIVRAIVGNPDDQQIKVTTIEVVQGDVADPSTDTFNAQALNPTVEVYVGDTSKQNTDQDSSTQTEDTSNNSQSDNSQNNSQNNGS